MQIIIDCLCDTTLIDFLRKWNFKRIWYLYLPYRQILHRELLTPWKSTTPNWLRTFLTDVRPLASSWKFIRQNLLTWIKFLFFGINYKWSFVNNAAKRCVFVIFYCLQQSVDNCTIQKRQEMRMALTRGGQLAAATVRSQFSERWFHSGSLSSDIYDHKSKQPLPLQLHADGMARGQGILVWKQRLRQICFVQAWVKLAKAIDGLSEETADSEREERRFFVQPTVFDRRVERRMLCLRLISFSTMKQIMNFKRRNVDGKLRRSSTL